MVSIQIRKFKKDEQKPKDRRMEKTRVKRDEIQSKNTLDSINKAKNLPFGVIKKDKPLVRPIKKKKGVNKHYQQWAKGHNNK